VTKNQGELGLAGASQTQEDIEILKQVSLLEKRLFKVSKRQSWWFELKRVYAVEWEGPEAGVCAASGGVLHTISCTGDIVCGNFREVCECSSTGEACSTAGNACGPWDNRGTCNCNPTGCTGSESRSCSGDSCSNNCDECQVADNCHGIRACVIDSPASCSGACCAAEDCIGAINDDGACAAQNPATPSCCGSCDSGDPPPGTIEGWPQGRFGVKFFYDENGNGDWDSGEDSLVTGHASVLSQIETVLNVPGVQTYRWTGQDIGSNVCLNNTFANCGHRGDSACVCPHANDPCGVVVRPIRQYVISGQQYWTCHGDDAYSSTLSEEGYHWVRAGTGNNCLGQEICVWRSGGLGLSINDPDVRRAPAIGTLNPNVVFAFNLPEGWKTTKIKWNTSYYPGSNIGSEIRESNMGVNSINTNLEAYNDAAYQFKISSRIIHVGVVEDVNPPRVIGLSASPAEICPGDEVQFQGWYIDEDGASDIRDVQMAIIDQDTVSGPRDFNQWYTRMSINLPQSGNPRFYLWGQNETYSVAASAGSTYSSGLYYLNSDLSTPGANATLRGDNNSWVRLDGNQVTAHWVVEFDTSYPSETYDLVLWTWDRDLNEDEPGDLLITRASGNPDDWEDFHYDDVIEMASKSKGPDTFGYRTEFVNLVRLAKSAR